MPGALKLLVYVLQFMEGYGHLERTDIINEVHCSIRRWNGR